MKSLTSFKTRIYLTSVIKNCKAYENRSSVYSCKHTFIYTYTQFRVPCITEIHYGMPPGGNTIVLK